MKIQMSPNIAVRHKNYESAVKFYADALGLENRSEDPALADFDTNLINLFVIEDDESSGPVTELFVDDLEAARDYLVAHGCEVLRWRGKTTFGIQFLYEGAKKFNEAGLLDVDRFLALMVSKD